MMEYRHAFEPKLRCRALLVGMLAVAAAAMLLENLM